MSVEDLLIERFFYLFGTRDLAEIIKNIEAERQGMRELHDENNALRIYNHRLRLVVDFAMRVFAEIEASGLMLLPPKVRDLIGQSRNQIALADRAILQSKALTELEHKV